MRAHRRYAFGAEVLPERAVTHFRIWAPARLQAWLVLEGAAAREVPLERDSHGFFSALVPDAAPGTLYRFRLEENGPLLPDPASRFQPEGPHGPSQVVDPGRFRWTDRAWTGPALRGQVLYEMHVGTFTRAGTWEAAARELPELAACGITCLEVMPVAEFAGRFGWGYDGVDLYAPTRLYGSPDDFRRFVDAAHGLGLAVILDVVYNHLGPDGNYLGHFARPFFSDRHKTDWGEAINFDGPDSGPVRDFFADNAAYWIDEFHLDGLRLDATQNIYDDAPPERHILAEVGRRVRQAARGRATLLVAENEPQHSELVRPLDQGGYGLDALWNDDYHHAAHVALTGRREAYYQDYFGSPQEFISALKYGYLYQGQWYAWQDQRRGRPALDLPPAAFVTFLENHDQVANSGRGLRSHQLTSPGRCRALTALTLLGPGTPMLFQGQEFAASAPFYYFADHNEQLAPLVQQGRREFLAQFPSLADPAMTDVVACPHATECFERCKLDFSERQKNAPFYALTRELLRLRREDPVFHAQKPRGMDGAVLGEQAFVLRFFAEDGLDRLLVVNLGRDLHLPSAPEPLLAPPVGCHWQVVLSTEDPRYGGSGTPPVETADEGWRIPGEFAALLVPAPGPTPAPEPAPPNGRVPAAESSGAGS